MQGGGAAVNFRDAAGLAREKGNGYASKTLVMPCLRSA
ncbi:hypothetical protein THTE_0723 [Thermogutta terrifontis]|uniref:Uncharacterized protein n=1 Tax=Thermogutta terrifontis TaxID=1331910 RepID=A0A286RBJ2_9BACT|nr:hypothetical protein THTE_0723 [Thermogutta terrifontis]